MIRRRPTSRSGFVSAEQDRALRTALFAAAESVEPGDDGLARIRAKIVEGQTGQARWRFGVRAAGEPWWRSLLPPRGWLPAVIAAVADRFRPDPNRAGWFGWLRPAAAVGTGLFVVTAASWAVAAFPAVIAPGGGTGGSVKLAGPDQDASPDEVGLARVHVGQRLGWPVGSKWRQVRRGTSAHGDAELLSVWFAERFTDRYAVGQRDDAGER